MARPAVETLILQKLAKGALYMRSFQQVKPVVERMIERGELRRVAPIGQRARNMVALAAPGGAKQPLSLTDSLAELVANGLGVNAAGEKLGLTKGRTARLWAAIKTGLGPQAR